MKQRSWNSCYLDLQWQRTLSDKGKGKVVAGDNKLKSNTRTKSCRKTLEPQFDGCLDDSSSEDEEDQAYDCDYEEESELYKEQVYDCSSEESDSSDCETISCDPMLSPDTDQRSPNVLPKEGCSKTNTKPTSSSKSTQIPKRTTSQKHCGYIDDGDPTHKCEHCGAIMWYGQVQLPLLKESPPTLQRLLYGIDAKSRYFRENIRQLNMVFSFTSLGGRCDRSVQRGCGPLKMFVLQGENYHLMGSLKPPPGDPAKEYKKSAESSKKETIRNQVIDSLLKMLNEVNPYVHQFRSSKDRFNTNPEEAFHMRIVSSREKDGKIYDTSDALIP
ncbi:unnamed protein product [Brassica oleracea]